MREIPDPADAGDADDGSYVVAPAPVAASVVYEGHDAAEYPSGIGRGGGVEVGAAQGVGAYAHDRTWQYLQTITSRRTDHDQYEADLAEALDQLMRRARAGSATRAEQHLLVRSAPTRTPPPPHPEPEAQAQAQQLSTAPAGAGEDSLDDFDQDAQDAAEDGTPAGPAARGAGYGHYDARAEALKW